MKVRLAVVIALCAAGAAGGCSDDSSREPVPTTVPTPLSALAQSNFADCAELRGYYTRAVTRLALETGVEPCWGCNPGETGAWFRGGLYGAALGRPEEEGADEADIIVADRGKGYIYLLGGIGGRELLTFDVVPAESMALRSRLDLGSGYHGARRLYLDSAGERLAVVRYFVAPGLHGSWSAFSEIAIYSLADPGNPQLVDGYRISGELLGARRVGQRLHLVTAQRARIPSFLERDASFGEMLGAYREAAEAQDLRRAGQLAVALRRTIAAAIAAAPIDALLPVWNAGVDPAAAFAPVACTDVARAEVEHKLGVVVVSSINLDGSDVAHAATVNEHWRLYASGRNLYLLQDSPGWFWSRAQTQQTAIYRYELGDVGPAQPTGHALVDGWAHHSYGLSERDGHLRVTTVQWRYVPEHDYWRNASHLFVLGATQEGSFGVTGSTRDFVPGQEYQAARLLGPRGFVYRGWAEPLVAFDLDSPLAPRRGGVLRTPSDLTYLHPFGDSRVLAVGRDRSLATNAWLHPVRLQMFDVTAFTAPQAFAEVVIGVQGETAWNVTMREPRAFSVSGDILLLPMQIGAPAFEDVMSGFLVYRLDAAAGFAYVGRADHTQAGGVSGCPPFRDVGPIADCAGLAHAVFPQPLRSVLLEEPAGRTVLYTLSDAFLRADAIGDTLTPIQSVPLAE